MKNAIFYYYELNPENIHQQGKKYCFKIDNDYYSLCLLDSQIDVNQVYKLNIDLLSRGIYNHSIILNKENQIITVIDQKKYYLLKLYDEMNQPISTDIILNFNFMTNKLVQEKKIEWKNLWEEKIDYFEYQISEIGVKYPLIRESMSYYIGLTENSISLLNEIDTANICLCHKRVNIKDTTFDFYHPFNLIFDSLIRDPSEYFKQQFFFENIDIEEPVMNYLNLINNNNDLKLFFIRMLYPSYYFDLYEQIIAGNVEEKKITIVTSKNKEYEKFLSNLYHYLRNQSILPEIDWLN